jgi:hypothetical protein
VGSKMKDNGKRKWRAEKIDKKVGEREFWG